MVLALWASSRRNSVACRGTSVEGKGAWIWRLVAGTRCGVPVRTMDEISKNLSAFVEERVDRPHHPDEIDLWSEAVYAALFSVAFEVIVRMKGPRKSGKAFRRAITKLIESISRHASSWVSSRLIPEDWQGPPIHIEVGPMIRTRLTMYFNEALHALTDRGYQLEVARSHACFAILNSAATALVINGLPLDSQQQLAFLEKVMASCDSMAKEMVEALERERRKT